MPTSTTTPAWADPNRRNRNADMDLPTFISRWEGQITSPETLRKYRPYFDLFMAWMERYSGLKGIDVLKDAGVAELEDYFDYLKSEHWDGHPGDCVTECESLPYKPASRKAKYDAISSAFNYAIVHQLRGTNPVRAIKLEKRPRKERHILLPWEVHDVIAAARKESLRSAVANGLAVGAGMRCEEIERVDIERFYQVPRGRMLHFQRKGGDWARIDIPRPVEPLLDEMIGDRTHGPLLMSTGRRTRNKATGQLEHTRLDASGIYRMVQRAGEECKLQLGPHDERATSITLALVDPAKPSIDRLMAYYGHKDFSTTMIYRHASRLPAGHHRNPYGIDWTTQAP
ncbi:site-specific integrase [Streptomyces scabiei]|uniref:tyrosine-type recombinase/integrase n=1 Tax=Streptomyces scabiei TaxID=1930 RepID=UPI0033C5271E